MKPISTSKKLPPELATPEGRAALLAKAAPPTEDEATVRARWANAVVVPGGGGPGAVREALAKRTRGPNKKPTKVPMTIRLMPATLERWKATGPGWQTRMAEALEKILVR